MEDRKVLLRLRWARRQEGWAVLEASTASARAGERAGPQPRACCSHAGNVLKAKALLITLHVAAEPEHDKDHGARFCQCEVNLLYGEKFSGAGVYLSNLPV